MNNSVHGHEVLQFMLENEQGFASKDSLKTAIETRFGATVRFHTCSADGLTAEQLVAFLSSKGILVDTGNGVNTQADLICSH